VLRKNRKMDRRCSVCAEHIRWGNRYESRGRLHICLSCVSNPPRIRAGVLNISVSGLQQCHECWDFYNFLGSHVHMHELTADEYKERWGLNRQTPLMSATLREGQSTVAKRNQDEGKFPSGDVGRRLLKSIREKKENITSARLQERLARSEKMKSNNPLSDPKVREKYLTAVRQRTYKKSI